MIEHLWKRVNSDVGVSQLLEPRWWVVLLRHLEFVPEIWWGMSIPSTFPFLYHQCIVVVTIILVHIHIFQCTRWSLFSFHLCSSFKHAFPSTHYINSSSSIIFCEAVAIFGIIVALIISTKIGDKINTEDLSVIGDDYAGGYKLFAAGLVTGCCGLFSGYVYLPYPSSTRYSNVFCDVILPFSRSRTPHHLFLS